MIAGLAEQGTTILLAWAVLGESLHAAQIAGFLLSLAGGLAVSALGFKFAIGSLPGTIRVPW